MNKLQAITQLYTTVEAKYVLLVMAINEVQEADYVHISDMCGLAVPEVADAANMLKVIGANKSRDFNRIKLDDRYFDRGSAEGIDRVEIAQAQSVLGGTRDSVCCGDSTTASKKSPA